jgi:hypothetical protein
VPSKLTISLVLKWGEITGSLLKEEYINHFNAPKCEDTTR